MREEGEGGGGEEEVLEDEAVPAVVSAAVGAGLGVSSDALRGIKVMAL